jgi:hypothetical protein
MDFDSADCRRGPEDVTSKSMHVFFEDSEAPLSSRRKQAMSYGSEPWSTPWGWHEKSIARHSPFTLGSSSNKRVGSNVEKNQEGKEMDYGQREVPYWLDLASSSARLGSDHGLLHVPAYELNEAASGVDVHRLKDHVSSYRLLAQEISSISGYVLPEEGTLIRLVEHGIIHVDLRPGFDRTANILCSKESNEMHIIDWNSFMKFEAWKKPAPEGSKYIENEPSRRGALGFVFLQIIYTVRRNPGSRVRRGLLHRRHSGKGLGALGDKEKTAETLNADS